MHRHLPAGQVLELLGEQLGLVGVEAGLVLVGPPLRVPCLELRRKEPAEDCVPGEWRGGRQDREIVRGLDVELLADDGTDHRPLVEPEAVDHHQQHLPVLLQHRPEELGADVHRQRRPVSLRVVEPAGVAGAEETAEILTHARLQRPKRILQSWLVRAAQPHFPLRQFHHQLHPLAPAERDPAPAFQFPEPGRKVARQPLLPDPVPFQEPGHHRQDLPRVDRLHQVVRDLGADGVLERVGFLALGDHHHRHRLVHRAYGAEQLESPSARHLLVQQHHAVGLPLHQDQCVIAVGRGLDRKALGLEEEHLGRQALDLIVHPENSLRPWHGSKVRATRGVGQRGGRAFPPGVSCGL